MKRTIGFIYRVIFWVPAWIVLPFIMISWWLVKQEDDKFTNEYVYVGFILNVIYCVFWASVIFPQ